MTHTNARIGERCGCSCVERLGKCCGAARESGEIEILIPVSLEEAMRDPTFLETLVHDGIIEGRRHDYPRLAMPTLRVHDRP
jgi:hypothetical protein